jgi:hypothetical protein
MTPRSVAEIERLRRRHGEFEHGPDQAQGAGLAGEAADRLGAAADLDEGALEQVGAADPLAVLGGPAQVRDERVEIALHHGHRRGYAVR